MRTSTCTPERVEALLGWLRKGHFRCVAARLAGISPNTLKDWLRADDTLVTLVRQAEAVAEAEAIEAIQRTAHPPTLLKWLAMRHRRRYYERGADKTVTHRYEKTPTAELEQMRQALIEKYVQAKEVH